MNILAIDTTTKAASVSVKTSENILTNTVTNEITHSEKLLPLIDNALNKIKLNIKDIELLACINGPGSFTGMRIGLSTLKAIAQVRNIDIFSIDSLELIAFSSYIKSGKFNENKDSMIISLIDAKNDRVYYSIYKLHTESESIKIEKLINIGNDTLEDSISKINSNLKDINCDVIIAGDCIDKFKSRINLDIKINYYFDFYPSTSDCISAYELIENKKDYTFSSYNLNATYARPSQAERLKDEQN